MLNGLKQKPAFRVVAWLVTVAVVGLFLGYAAERLVAAEHEEQELEAALDEDPMIYTQPTEQSSGWEEQVIARATAGLPQYPNSNAAALAADYHGAEAPIAVAWFNTKDEPGQVLDWYQAKFEDAGIPPLVNRVSENNGYVAYMVPSSGDMRVITAVKQGEQTVVFASNGNLTSLLEASPNVPPEVLLPDGVDQPMVLTLNQEGSADVSVVASVDGTDLEALVKFYKEGFEKRGWKVEEVSRLSPDEAHVQAALGGRHAFASLRRTKGASKIEILVRMTGRA